MVEVFCSLGILSSRKKVNRYFHHYLSLETHGTWCQVSFYFIQRHITAGASEDLCRSASLAQTYVE